MPIQPDDLISRCIVYDKAFSGPLHTDAVLFGFGPAQEDGAAHESGVLRRVAPLDEDVHSIGCQIAFLQNERKNNPPRGPKRKYYCGFRTARAGDIPTGGDGYEIRINWDGIGYPAHVDIALSIASQSKNERATIRTDAGLALAEVFGEPKAHICEPDAGDEHHPLAKDPDCLWRGIPRLETLMIAP